MLIFYDYCRIFILFSSKFEGYVRKFLNIFHFLQQTIGKTKETSRGSYLLCGFVAAVLLLAVGTFVTSHAYQEEEKDKILIFVGPILLVIGGINFIYFI